MHQEQEQFQQRVKPLLDEGLDEFVSAANTFAARAEATGDEYDQRVGAAMLLTTKGYHATAAKAWRKLIKMQTGRIEPYLFLGNSLEMTGPRHHPEAAKMYLKAMCLLDEDTETWAATAASVFNVLKLKSCREAPKPEWWNNEELKALSARVVALVPDTSHARSLACVMRATLLSDGGTGWSQLDDPETRTAVELKEAASWWRRAARATKVPATALGYEAHATYWDKYADPLLAKAEAEAKKARATAEIEAAATRKAAEEKANAAAEELLAEEEKEKQEAAASTKDGKAKRGKGKKGKGGR